VWSVAVYGAETWTTTNAGRERLEAFEMRFWQRMEKTGWVELSFPGTFASRNFRSLELSLPGTVIPWNFSSLELSLSEHY